MTTTMKLLDSTRKRHSVRLAYFLAGILACLPGYGKAANLADQPLFIINSADPSVLLNMSVETPMGGAAYADQPGNPTGCGIAPYTNPRPTYGGGEVGICYIPTTTYLGYFDPNKCYVYTSSRFEPSSATGALHQCNYEWSGNFLNWASMTAIDEFIWTMTGGNRIVDTTSETVIRRARKENNDSWFPHKLLNSTYNVLPSTVTPFSDPDIFIYNTDWGINVGTTRGGTQNGPFNIDVKVCVAVTDAGRESNCVAYTSGATTYYKPEGLLQENADKMRFALTSYTFDNLETRDGGVLRSKMKYIGPTRPASTGTGTETNPNAEFGIDGLFINNPDVASGGLNSGVINYVNKFSDPGYKSYDPIGELYYESLRYFKDLGPTPEYSSGLTAAQKGDFDIITSWDDPYQYSCQKCFIIGINDANPWLDKKLPGTFFTSSTISGAGGTNYTLIASDYGQPNNADSSIDVRALTNQVGSMEGLNGTTWTNSGTWTSGTASGTNDSVGGGPGTFDNICSNKTVGNLGEVMGTCPSPGKQNSYYIAGLSYYANTQDLRSDLAGKQTVSSFFIDTQEYSTNPLDGNKNMLWLAGKYGGFIDSDNDNTPNLRTEWDGDNDGVPDNYVRTTEPDKLVTGLNAAFQDIFERTASASSVAINTTSVQANSALFQAKFNSADWSGQLLSIPVNLDGSLGTAQWDAADKLPSPNARKIVTLKPSAPVGTKGILFRWPDLDTLQSAELDKIPGTPTPDGKGEDRLNYLRGSDVPGFRTRTKKLGDIVNSSPAYVGAPLFRYPDNLETDKYSDFKTANKNRKGVVYVGANDGMLHGFDAASGDEVFAYVPAAVYGKLNQLTDANYPHTYYVDGAPTVGDAFFGGSWHTVLVGGLRKGGQAVYALDITTPPDATSTESTIKAKVLWEFNDVGPAAANDPAYGDNDLGYTFSEPNIVRLHNGKWAAVFGNGYNNTEADGQASTTGNAVLYIVDLETGMLITSIDTGKGMSADPKGLNRPNGLATPAPADVNGDSIVDYIYAGDLFGNLWKFDVTGSNETQWQIPYTSGGNPQPLFVACAGTSAADCTTQGAATKRQPITSRPQVGRHPTKAEGFMVYFGTGQYIFDGDNDPMQQDTFQTFYGVWDENQSSLTAFDRTKLLEQKIVKEISQGFDSNGDGTDDDFFDLRVTTDDPINWDTPAFHKGWYMDLYNTEGGNTNHFGERQVTDSILRNNRIIFTTLIPSADPCDFGGTGWLMEIDAKDGSRLEFSPFDLNADGEFDGKDHVKLVDIDGDGVLDPVPPSGKKSKVGIPPTPGVVSDSSDPDKPPKELKYTSGSTGKIEVTTENPGSGNVGRRSWRELNLQ